MSKSFLNQSGLPLALRNNNPGNVRPVSPKWNGQIGVNKNFAVFSNISMGVRAMAIDTIGDIFKDGKNTLNKLMPEYAPPGDNNDTKAYIATLAKKVGIKPDEKIPASIDVVTKILKAITEVEIGQKYKDLVTLEDIKEGILKSGATTLARIGVGAGGGGILGGGIGGSKVPGSFFLSPGIIFLLVGIIIFYYAIN